MFAVAVFAAKMQLLPLAFPPPTGNNCSKGQIPPVRDFSFWASLERDCEMIYPLYM